MPTQHTPLHSVSEDGRACFRSWTRLLGGVMLQQAHLRYDSHAAVLELLIISELTQKRIWILECIYALYVYILNPYPLLVRSAYYYVVECWRAPRTCLQSWQTTQIRDLLFMYMRCVPHDYPYWLCLSPHPRPLGRWGSGTFLVRTYYVSQAKRYRISVIFKIPYDEFSFVLVKV